MPEVVSVKEGDEIPLRMIPTDVPRITRAAIDGHSHELYWNHRASGGLFNRLHCRISTCIIDDDYFER